MDIVQIFLATLLTLGGGAYFALRWKAAVEPSPRDIEEANAKMLLEQHILSAPPGSGFFDTRPISASAFGQHVLLARPISGAALQINAVDGRRLTFISDASGSFGKIKI